MIWYPPCDLAALNFNKSGRDFLGILLKTRHANHSLNSGLQFQGKNHLICHLLEVIQKQISVA